MHLQLAYKQYILCINHNEYLVMYPANMEWAWESVRDNEALTDEESDAFILLSTTLYEAGLVTMQMSLATFVRAGQDHMKRLVDSRECFSLIPFRMKWTFVLWMHDRCPYMAFVEVPDDVVATRCNCQGLCQEQIRVDGSQRVQEVACLGSQRVQEVPYLGSHIDYAHLEAIVVEEQKKTALNTEKLSLPEDHTSLKSKYKAAVAKTQQRAISCQVLSTRQDDVAVEKTQQCSISCQLVFARQNAHHDVAVAKTQQDHTTALKEVKLYYEKQLVAEQAKHLQAAAEHTKELELAAEKAQQLEANLEAALEQLHNMEEEHTAVVLQLAAEHTAELQLAVEHTAVLQLAVEKAQQLEGEHTAVLQLCKEHCEEVALQLTAEQAQQLAAGQAQQLQAADEQAHLQLAAAEQATWREADLEAELEVALEQLHNMEEAHAVVLEELVISRGNEAQLLGLREEELKLIEQLEIEQLRKNQ